MRNTDGHRRRLREKFLEFGLGKFTDDEIVEMLLTLATPRKDCKLMAREALKRFGNLAGVLEASPEELQKVDGIGPSNAFGVHLIHSIARKFLRQKIISENYVNSFDEALDYLTHALRELRHEVFHILFLNSQNAILHEERVSSGTTTHVVLYPRQVLETAFAHAATNMVLAHNHPGGSAQPSEQDVRMTRQLYFAARGVELTVREHIIISADGYYSFMREGVIASFEKEYQKHHKKLWR